MSSIVIFLNLILKLRVVSELTPHRGGWKLIRVHPTLASLYTPAEIWRRECQAFNARYSDYRPDIRLSQPLENSNYARLYPPWNSSDSINYRAARF